MKITADLICRAGQFLNALKERELDLRGYKVPAIENLGATQVSWIAVQQQRCP
jgi:U2 small nuclear ribonucleoprotein A'